MCFCLPTVSVLISVSVRARLNSQQGLSFTELTYQLLQAYDFYHLHKHFNCTIQVGGSDQWGNILAGLELINRLDSHSTLPLSSSESAASAPEAYGITTPLLTTASGEKFGKSAGNAVWLDPTMTSVFDFYQVREPSFAFRIDLMRGGQYFIKVDDADVEKYLKLLTLLPSPQISEIMDAHTVSFILSSRGPIAQAVRLNSGNPKNGPLSEGWQLKSRSWSTRVRFNVSQRLPSLNVCPFTAEGLTHARTLTKLLFESDIADLQTQPIISAFEADPRLVILNEEELLSLPVTKLAAKYGLAMSAGTCTSRYRLSSAVRLFICLPSRRKGACYITGTVCQQQERSRTPVQTNKCGFD